MRKRLFIKNTLILTLTAAALRLLGLGFQIYMTNRVGAAGTGLFFLVMPVGAFAATFAISGSRFTATRLSAEELGKNNGKGALTVVYKCLLYALGYGLAAFLLLFFGAGFVGEKLMGEARAVVSLRIFSLDMPFISMGAVLGGYFTARKKAGILAAIQLFEQIVRIAATMAALRSIDVGSLESSCAAMVFGSVSGETAGFLLSAVMFIIDRRALKIGNSPPGVFRRIIKIAPPLAVAAYVRTALNALCGMLVPRGLRSYGAEAEAALSSYGVINGMALPIAAFPSALFLSVAELVVPEMTEAQVNGSW